MKTLPKPTFCGQDWLEMSPMDNGRLCGQCKKNIIDFTDKKWADIEKIQRENNNSICGMYSDKQLKYWGQEIPNSTTGTILATTLLLGLTTTNLIAQNEIKNDTTKVKIIIQGQITGKTMGGEIYELAATTVSLKNTKIGTYANNHGFYELDVTDYIDSLQEPTIEFSMVGFNKIEIKLDSLPKGASTYNIQLIEETTDIIYFYVSKPTLKQRIKWKLKKWFK